MINRGSATKTYGFARKGAVLVPLSIIVSGGSLVLQQGTAGATCSNVGFPGGDGQNVRSNEVHFLQTGGATPAFHLEFTGNACTDGQFLTDLQVNESDIQFVKDTTGWIWPDSASINFTYNNRSNSTDNKGRITQSHTRMEYTVNWGAYSFRGDYDVIINGDGNVIYQHFWAGDDFNVPG